MNDKQNSKSMFEAYGDLADEINTPILIAGRNLQHENQMDDTIADICAKLEPNKNCRLLELGCNIGMLLNPLSSLVASGVGLDHHKLVGFFRDSGTPENVALLEGEWPTTKVEGSFDRILVYDVLHLVPDAGTALKFIEACYDILEPGGRLLIGDLPNKDMHKRYQSTEFGQKVAADYDAAREKERANITNESQQRTAILSDALFDNYMDDAFIFSVLGSARKSGLHAFTLPQPDTLPFCFSREDILIARPR